MDPEADGPVLLDDAPVQGEEEVEMHSLQLDQPQGGLRRIRVFPRSAVQFSVESFENKETAPPEQVWLISGGVNLLIDGINLQTGPIGSGSSQGPVDLSADRIVIWTLMGGGESDLQGEGTLQSTETPMQIYLEGNIVIRQGQNTMRAARAFYDARDNRALLLNAELKTKLPQVGGDVRIRANEIRQLAEQTYEAKSAWISTSQFGQPGYRMQADSIFIEPWEEDWIYRSRERDPETGELIDPPTLWATSQNNTFYLNQYPLMYFPSLTFPAEDPNIPLRNIRFGNDQVLGTQLYTTWNLFKLIGVRRPNDTRLDLHADYLTKRGLEGGLTGSYAGANRFTENDRYEGKGLGFYIRDQGLDNLGSDRRSLPLQQSDRGRINIWDRQRFADGHTLYTEFGYVSDRNVLEQYDEQAFDLSKDYETMVYLSRNVDNWAYTAAIRPRMYNYYNESEYLPKGDFYLLGQPFMDGWMSYSTHTTAGYATQKIADAPFDPSLDIYSVLPYEGNASGVLLSTRHQIDTVFNLGPARIMPYAQGEASYWGQDYTGNSLDRLYGVGGVRSSLEFWKVFPDVENGLMNVSGLAHKATLFADYSYAYANRSLAGIPQFNEFDDNSQEQFHRRLLYNTFGGTVPPQFQSREFAVRTGAAQSVTAPYYELVDTRQALRFGIQQRLQTKRGPVNDQRIVDWMTLDLETTFFPDAQRDNFGQQFGLYGGRYNWYVGDRTSITANAYFDTFDQAQRLWSVGINSYRGSRGLVYLGYRQIEAFNFRSQIVTAFYTYQHSPKWSSTIMTAYDVGQQQNLGQSITLTRTGADFLVHLGLIVDPTKSNVGVGVSVEPRFLQLSNSLGQMNNFLSGGQNR